MVYITTKKGCFQPVLLAFDKLTTNNIAMKLFLFDVLPKACKRLKGITSSTNTVQVKEHNLNE